METFKDAYENFDFKRSYPTYEEWKLSFFACHVHFVIEGSYPTYEEWKHNAHNFRWYSKYCSYPTYEEWKRGTRYKIVSSGQDVLILPMRNGNKKK